MCKALTPDCLGFQTRTSNICGEYFLCLVVIAIIMIVLSLVVVAAVIIIVVVVLGVEVT